MDKLRSQINKMESIALLVIEECNKTRKMLGFLEDAPKKKIACKRTIALEADLKGRFRRASEKIKSKN